MAQTEPKKPFALGVSALAQPRFVVIDEDARAVVRTDVAEQQQLAGTLSFAGSFSVAGQSREL